MLFFYINAYVEEKLSALSLAADGVGVTLHHNQPIWWQAGRQRPRYKTRASPCTWAGLLCTRTRSRSLRSLHMGWVTLHQNLLPYGGRQAGRERPRYNTHSLTPPLPAINTQRGLGKLSPHHAPVPSAQCPGLVRPQLTPGRCERGRSPAPPREQARPAGVWRHLVPPG